MIGIELKNAYYLQAVQNMKRSREDKPKEMTLQFADIES